MTAGPPGEGRRDLPNRGRSAPRVAATLVSAAATALLFPPWDTAWLTWVALVPFLLALRDAGGATAFALGVVWGVAEHWATAYWMLPAISDYYGQPAWFAATFGVISSLVYRGSIYGLLALLLAVGCRRLAPAARPPFSAALWVAVELVRARGPSEDPWLLLGYALLPYAQLVQSASLAGVHGLTFLVVLVNSAITESAAPLLRRRALPGSRLAAITAPPALLLAATWLYGATRPPVRADPADLAAPLRVAIVQGNNQATRQWDADFEGDTLAEYLRLSRRAAAGTTDLLIWPESAVTFFLAREDERRRPVVDLLRDSGADLVTGAPHFTLDDPALPEFRNSAFYVTAGDGVADRYDKVTLLPFAEYYPLRIGALLRRRFAVRSFTPGDATRPLRTRFGPLAVAICFEAVHPEAVRQRMTGGAVALLNLSNDGWLGDGAGPAQHFAMTRLRAVEHDVWLLRSTTTGISAVVDPRGRTVARIPPRSAAFLRATFEPRTSSTLYRRWGDWWAYLCALAAPAIGILLRRRR